MFVTSYSGALLTLLMLGYSPPSLADTSPGPIEATPENYIIIESSGNKTNEDYDDDD